MSKKPILADDGGRPKMCPDLSPRPIDPVTFNVVLNSLFQITEEMGINLLLSARSTIIREARDASCALLDSSGQIVAQAEHIPVQLCSLSLPLKSCLAKHGSIRPGEAFITNDPYSGGQHLQDIIIFSPIFYRGELIAFSGSIAHHIDIGGASAGMTYDATEYYQEGLLLPSLKVNVARDFRRGGLLHDLFRANFREPTTTLGDIKAQLAANRTGEMRLIELVEKKGLDLVKDCMAASIDYSERLMRAAIKSMPDGEYEASDMLDDGVFAPDPIPIKLKLAIADTNIKLDFSGTGPQRKEFINSPLGSTLSTIYSCVKMVASIFSGAPIPANEGINRPIEALVESGSLLNPIPPAPVRARMCTCYRVFDSIIMAFQKAMPEKMPALGFHVNTTSGLSHFSQGKYRIFIEDIGGGWGGTPERDGADFVDTPLSNCKITPVEAIELDHPYMMIERFELLPDSAGAGKCRGGLGMVRQYRVLEDGVEFFGYADRHKFAPKGANGGADGTMGKFSIIRNGSSIELPSKIKCKLQRGDILSVVAGGGGGWGDPRQRASEQIEEELLDGKLSLEFVKKHYSGPCEKLKQG